MSTIHILTQYVWPDAAPTGLYAEQLAERLHQEGCEVRLVGGRGGYRTLHRPKPEVPLVHLDHRPGRRGNLFQTMAEYAAVKGAFQNYVKRSVRAGDTVIVTSAPPNTVSLARAIRARGARAIYWLQDYYPELIRGLREYPQPLRKTFRHLWDRQLGRWDCVVKIGANLGGPEQNSVVIRNWPTIEMNPGTSPESGTALYSGNLGYGHDVDLLVSACEKLRGQGFRITIRADGRGVRHLPEWLRAVPLHNDLARLRDDLLRHEVHLVAADPRITQAVFPSKIWNSFAAERQVVCTGFHGEMARELETASIAPFAGHLGQWSKLILNPRAFPARMQMTQLAPVQCGASGLQAAKS